MSSKTRARNTRTLRSVPDQSTTAAVRTETADKLWAALHANPNSAAADLSVAAKIGKSTAGKILAKWASEGSVTRTSGIAEGGRRAADLWAVAEATPGNAAVDADTSTDRADTATAEPTPDKHADCSADPGIGDIADAASIKENFAEPADAGSTDATPGDAQETTDTTTDAIHKDARDAAAKTADEETELADAAPDSTRATEPVGKATPNDATDTASKDRNKGKSGRLAPGALRGMVEEWLRDHPGEQAGPTRIAKDLGGESGGAVNNIRGPVEETNESKDTPATLEQEITDVLTALESDGVTARVGSGEQAQWRAVAPPRKRLPQGGLQGMVEDFLAEHADQEFGPHAIGAALSRSSGAVANALVRLTERGAAVQVSQHPRRYRAAATS